MNTKSAAQPPVARRLDEDESIGEWLAFHKNAVGWALAGLAILVGAGWFYQRSQTIRAERAESSYYQARREAAAGNAQLAMSDLRKMADRYSGTRAGSEGRIYLAQMLFAQGKFTEGIAELKTATKSIGSKDDLAASLHVLEANGYEELKDFTSAASEYGLAAEATRFPNDKNGYKAFQARALMTAGKRNEAMAIWQDLAKDEGSAYALEAKLRIGELEATPAKS